MVSLGLFNKDLSGYPGSAIVNTASTTATGPVGGAYWNAALGNGCTSQDLFCIRDYIFTHFNGQPGVAGAGVGADGHQAGTIQGVPGDPGEKLILTTSANQNDANVNGAEINWQHMFDNGFGFQANYTYVKSDLHYDNNSLSATQFAMIGLSNSANLVGIYENKEFTARLAYNWRGYNINKNLSVSLEGINLTNATQRMHGRDSMQVLQAVQYGPRYMIGARYKF